MMQVKIHIIFLIILVLTVFLHAEDSEDFLRFLEARDESIKNYQIKLRQMYFEIELADFDAFKKDIEQLAQNEVADSNPSQQAEKLIQKWTENIKWFNINILHRGERFKETRVYAGSRPSISCYDGQLYYDYDEHGRQLDIHAKIPNVAHICLDVLGFFSKGPINSTRLLSFEQDNDGVRCEFSHSDDDSRITLNQYGREFGLIHSEYRHSEKIRIFNYYLFLKTIDSYRIPEIKINFGYNARRDTCTVSIYVIEDVKFNCQFTDGELSLKNIPDDTLVIDYRFEPAVQWRYSDYCEAAANPDVVCAGRAELEDMIRFLNNTRSERDALLVQDSRTGRNAPPLHVKEWLLRPPVIDKWPPDKFTVLEFWDKTCGPCVGSIHENNELAEWIRTKGGLFVSIHSAGGEPDKVIDFMANHNVQYAVGMDEPDNRRIYWSSATFAEYGIDGIPSYVTINESGRVISYRDMTVERLKKLLEQDANNEALAEAGRKEARKLTAIPNSWLAGGFEPDSKIQGRFFVFRPETPDLKINKVEITNEAVKSEISKHSIEGQTLYEVALTTVAPDWGQKLEGYVTLTTEHSNMEELLIIPYNLRAKSLAGCVSPVIWFGTVRIGQKTTRAITLQNDANRNIIVKPVSTPANLKLSVAGREQKSNNFAVECGFSSNKSGFHKGTVELLACDDKGNTQPLTLDYYAFVLP